MSKKISKVIAIVSPKGGAGKTTTSANLGVVFSQYGVNTLVLDTNITTASLGFHFGLTNPKVTFKEVLDENLSITKAIYEYNEHLHIIPSALSIELRYRPLTLQEKVRELADHYDILLTELTKKYDLILLDSAPGFNAESIAAMVSSDALIMVTNPELPSVIAAAKGAEYAKFLKRRIIGIVLNKVTHKDYELNREEIEKSIGFKVIAEIPYDENIPRSIANKKPVVDFKKFSEASIAYKKLGAGLIGEEYELGFIERILQIIRM